MHNGDLTQDCSITSGESMLTILAAALLSCTVTDGDTIRCGKERVRLLGIDAPEIHGCRRGRVCVPGDGQASKRSLVALIGGRKVRIERHGQDRYGRTLAYVWAGRVNLSCEQVRRGQAVWVEKWNTGGRGC